MVFCPYVSLLSLKSDNSQLYFYNVKGRLSSNGYLSLFMFKVILYVKTVALGRRKGTPLGHRQTWRWEGLVIWFEKDEAGHWTQETSITFVLSLKHDVSLRAATPRVSGMTGQYLFSLADLRDREYFKTKLCVWLHTPYWRLPPLPHGH